MNRWPLLSFFCLYTAFASAQVATTLHAQADKEEMTRWVDSVYASMTADERVGQLFMPIVEPRGGWKKKVEEYITQQKVGGLLFSKGTLASQAEVTNYAQAISRVPLMVALDGEWGLSMRLSDAPPYPRNLIIGAIQDEETLMLYGKEVARQCREMGIHINFAPSLDVHTNPLNPVIGTRSYGENPQEVARLGIAYARGLEANGVMAVAKHFPGHGDTAEDSHKTLPTIIHQNERLEEVELYPFRKYIESGLSGMMTGHLNVPALNTKGLPSSLSPEIGLRLLKEEMGFTGLTFTDGMAMKGVSQHADASVKALLAGNDIVLGVVNLAKECTSVKRAVEKGTITASLLEEKVRKILTYKYILGAHRFTPINRATIHSRVNSSSAEWIQRRIYDKALTLVKNEDALIPFKGLDKVKIASVAVGAPSSNTFQQYLKKYGDVATFSAESVAAVAAISELDRHDLVILSLHSEKEGDAVALHQLINDRKVVLVFFSSPSRLSAFQQSVDKAAAVIMAYDTTAFAQRSAAQAIFGGIAMRGKLPVTSGTFMQGVGIETEKTRLGYSLPEEVGIPSERLHTIESIAMEGIRQRAYPGCQILVAKEGVVIYERAFGRFDYGDGAAVTDETVYDLASVTKALATLPAIMKLYDEKKIRLQDPISRFVPETRRSDKANITIRALLFHESGITSFIPYYTTAIDKNSYTGPLFGRQSPTYHVRYAGAWARTDYKFLPALISTEPSDKFHLPIAKELYGSDEMHRTLLKEVIDTPLRTKGRYLYSCLNFMLLKEAVEALAGDDLDSYVKQQYYRPLGATTTTFQPLRSIPLERIPATEDDPFFRKQHVQGYVHDEGAALFGGISGNAGLFSNAGDLAKLCQMWLNGGDYGGERLLSEETVRLFTTMKSTHSRRGLGFDKPDPKNGKTSPTSPGTPIEVYGHTGFTGTCFWIDPTNDLIYIFLSNRVNPSRTPNRLSTLNIRERIQEELYRAMKEKREQ